MTKAELINAVAQKTELSKKDSEKAVVAVLDAIPHESHRVRCLFP